MMSNGQVILSTIELSLLRIERLTITAPETSPVLGEPES